MSRNQHIAAIWVFFFVLIFLTLVNNIIQVQITQHIIVASGNLVEFWSFIKRLKSSFEE